MTPVGGDAARWRRDDAVFVRPRRKPKGAGPPDETSYHQHIHGLTRGHGRIARRRVWWQQQQLVRYCTGLLVERARRHADDELDHERRLDLESALLAARPDQRSERLEAERPVAHPSSLGHRRQVLRRSPADRVPERDVRRHRRRRRVRDQRQDRRQDVDTPRASQSGDQDDLLRLDEPRGRARRRQGLRRAARRQVGRARSEDRPDRVVDPGWALSGGLHDHERAALLQRPRLHRRLRRRVRHPRPPDGLQRQDGQGGLALLHHSRPRAGRARHLAGRQRCLEARRRTRLADTRRRPEARADLLLDRERIARLQRRGACGRQLVRVVDPRARCEHRHVPLALPGSPPRHLGLRRSQPRRPLRRLHRRSDTPRDRPGGEDRLGVHPRPRDRQAADRDGRASRSAGPEPEDCRHTAVSAG